MAGNWRHDARPEALPYLGLPFDEVARVMNRTVGACQMLMLRAARSLRAALAAEGVRSG